MDKILKTRLPWLLYVAFIVTGGIFMLVWIVLLMQDINRFENRTIFPVKLWVVICSLGMIVHLIFFLVVLSKVGTHPQGVPALLREVSFAWAIALSIFLYGTVVFIARRIVKVSGHAFGVWKGIAVFMLTTMAGLSFPLLQWQLNKVIERAQLTTAR